MVLVVPYFVLKNDEKFFTWEIILRSFYPEKGIRSCIFSEKLLWKGRVNIRFFFKKEKTSRRLCYMTKILISIYLIFATFKHEALNRKEKSFNFFYEVITNGRTSSLMLQIFFLYFLHYVKITFHLLLKLTIS